MKTLVFTIANWKFALENKLVLSAMSLEDNNDYSNKENIFEIEHLGVKTKVFNLAKIFSLTNLEKSEKIILLRIENRRFGILVDRILGIKELNFKQLPPYLVLKGKIKPIEGLNENQNELITLISSKILENLIKENQ
ncbi:MAG: chemotaxis protein CheW [Leptospiraceae bacterium]|nr:chemotaxis protein CheW [Leptospiraceae bacterium]